MVAWEVGVVLVVIAVVLMLFVTEALPISITALAGTVILLITGVLTPEQGLAGFSNPATITVLAMFVLSAGLERTGVIHRVTHWLLQRAGRNPRRQALILGSVAGPVSGFLNNTAVVAIFIPAALRMSRESGRSPSKILMPLSFFAITGGMLTVIGTSTNLLGNGLLPRFGVAPFGFFEFTLIGIVALAATVVYFVTFGFNILPERGAGDIVDPLDLQGFMAEFQVPRGAPVEGKTFGEADLRGKAQVQVVHLVRGIRRIAPTSNRMLRAGDLLLIQGSRERLENLTALTGLIPLPEVKHPLTAPRAVEGRITTAEALIPPGSDLEGNTIAGLRFNNRYGVQVLAVRHHGSVAIAPLSRQRFSAGDVLLVQGATEDIDRLAQDADFVLTRERGRHTYRTDRLPAASLIMLGVVAVAAVGLLPIVTTALAGAILMVLTRCLRVGEFLDAVHWDIILLLAGAIPLGIALETSGAAALLASGLVPLGEHLPALVFLMTIFFLTSLLTEVVSNNASVVLVIPIAVAAAIDVGLDPRPFALAVILAASASMLTPIGYQTNTMVYSAGRYRFTDFTRVGGPLTIILTLLIPFMIALLFPLQ